MKRKTKFHCFFYPVIEIIEMGKFEKLKSVTIVQHPLLLLLLLPVYFTIKDYSKLIDELSPFFLITVGGITASVLLLTALYFIYLAFETDIVP